MTYKDSTLKICEYVMINKLLLHAVQSTATQYDEHDYVKRLWKASRIASFGCKGIMVPGINHIFSVVIV